MKHFTKRMMISVEFDVMTDTADGADTLVNLIEMGNIHVRVEMHDQTAYCYVKDFYEVEKSLVGKQVLLKDGTGEFNDWGYLAEIISDKGGPFQTSPQYVVEYWENETGTNEIYRIDRDQFKVIEK